MAGLSEYRAKVNGYDTVLMLKPETAEKRGLEPVAKAAPAPSNKAAGAPVNKQAGAKAAPAKPAGNK
ncbi:MAG: hypothetical protein QJR09_05280 [Micrococcus sp.]|nr:hypothetical protein [Micrococcus sp.]